MKKNAPKSLVRKSRIWVFVLLILAAVAAIGFALLPRVQDYPLEITTIQAFEKYDSGVLILDVRQPEEWKEGHISGATLIPLGELQSRLKELPRDREIVVVCRSGNRSQEGRNILRAAGLTQVTSMKGGMIDWISSGYPTVAGE